ncbi:SulP family inorganic anion transporter [Azonexus sp.]|uniref:SulP family inorganic anion transporter n=1 Tax=Azonexus sp. TaxID=1872668 RepID=UPI0027BAD8BB|nr:sulfate permease [Azonexus sp.]
MMCRLLPHWASPYPRQHLGSDVLAGIIVTILVIPQSLAYALLAGLPPQTGLYISIFPVIAYALFGSSMVQAVGPVAITAIMTFSVLTPLAPPGSAEYLVLAATLALGSGLLLLAGGLLRLGFLAQLLSRPVISGFISGSAVLIVFSQLKHLFGLTSGSTDAWHLAGALLTETRIDASTAIGFAAIVLLAFARWGMASLLGKIGLSTTSTAFIVRLMPLFVVLGGTLAVIGWQLDSRYGVAVVGRIAEGLPGFQLFLPGLAELKLLVVPILLMALIGMVQNISMAQALAIKRRERIDANAELLGLGSANIVAAFYGGMPVGGGVSRSAVNVAAGAQTPLASIVSAFAMLAVVAGAAPLFARLPLAVLAASIIVAAISMIDLRALRQTWDYDRADGLAALGAAAGVCALGLEAGIALGILFSLATLLYRASTPHIAVLGRIPHSEHFRNVERHAVETIPGVLFLRIDESLFFGNLNAVETRLAAELDKSGDKSEEIRDVVLIMSAVNRVDATAMEVLSDINRDFAERGRRLHLAEIKGPVQDRLSRSPLWPALSGQVFLAVNDAFETLSGAAASGPQQEI